MKKFLSKVLIIGIIIILCLILTEIYVRSIPNEYSYKRQYLENHMDSIRILVVGSSVGRAGINPACFSKYTFNASNVSQDLETDCAIIEKYLPLSTNLKAVVFALLPTSYCGRMGEGVESWRLRKYHIYMNLDIDKPIYSDMFEINNLSSALQQIERHLNGLETMDCYENGMGNDTIVVNELEKTKQATRISKIHNESYNPKNYDIVVPCFKKTIADLTTKGIKVLLVLMPSDYTYRERISPKMLSECDSISAFVANSNPLVKYINLFGDSTLTTEDFRNSNHLSQKGAVKISLLLNGIIEEIDK